MHSDVYEWIWFKLGMTIETLHIDTSLSDLDLHSRSQGCEKTRTSASIIRQSSSIDLDEIWYTVTTRWFDESQSHFVSSNILSRKKSVFL